MSVELDDPTGQYTLQAAVRDTYGNAFVVLGQGTDFNVTSRLYYGGPTNVAGGVLLSIPTIYRETRESWGRCGERRLRPYAFPGDRPTLRWQAEGLDDRTASLVQQHKQGKTTRYGWRPVETAPGIALRLCRTLPPLDRKSRPHPWANVRFVVVGTGECLSVEPSATSTG